MRHLILGLLTLLFVEAGSTAAGAQTAPSSTSASQPSRGVGNQINYPPGTQIYPNGTIQTPTGTVIYPSVAVPGEDGSTTYYYRDGTRINAGRGAFSSSGTYLIPGTINGGVGNQLNTNSTRSFFIPGGLGKPPVRR